MSGELERLSQARTALAEARTLQEVKAILDVATAARAYARARDLGQESMDYAQEIVNRATRQMGQLLATSERHAGGRPKTSDNVSQVNPPTLRDMGIGNKQASRAQQVARLPEQDFEALVTKPQNRLLRIQRDRDAESARIAKARTLTAPPETRIDLRHGDFREVLSDVQDVDAIITDPPYPGEFLPLLDDLAAWSDKVLTPDGVLVVLMGQTHLPEVYRRLGTGRPYRWTGAYLTPGAGYVSQARRVQSNWKPLLVYGGGRRFADTVRTEATDADAKNHHEWGQDYGAFHTIVERFTEPGQTVADPFMGSGTTLLAAKALARNAIGAELDVEHFATARRRLQPNG